MERGELKISLSLSYLGEKVAWGWGGGMRGAFGNTKHKSPRKSRYGSLQPRLSLAGGQKLFVFQNKE